MTENMDAGKSGYRKNNGSAGGRERYLDTWTARKIGVAQDGLTRETLEAYTEEKLRETLAYAVSSSPFYQRKYGKIVQADDGRSVSDGRGGNVQADDGRAISDGCGTTVLANDGGSVSEGCGRKAKETCSGDAGGVRGGGASLAGQGADFLHSFQKLPFTTQDELRRHGMDFLCVRPGEISRIVTLDTGGSTGLPKRIYFTEEDQHLTVDYFQNGMQLLVSECDTVLILMPAKSAGSIGKLLAKGVAGFGAKVVEYGLPQMRRGMVEAEIDEEAAQILNLMESQQVTSVVALPTHMRMLAKAAMKRQGDGYRGQSSDYQCALDERGLGRRSDDYSRQGGDCGRADAYGQQSGDCRQADECRQLDDRGWPDGESSDKSARNAQSRKRKAGVSLDAKGFGSGADSLSLKSVLLSAEYVAEDDVRLIEQVFSCKVYEHYGMTEMGLGCAVSCGHGAGYHVREADLYLEIIDPETQAPAAEGELGEIVFTTLTRQAMPFIRYRTGDYSRWITEKCPCGSTLKRLDKVRPRNAVKGYLREKTR